MMIPDQVLAALERLKVHEHDGIVTFLFDCQRCADLHTVELTMLRQGAELGVYRRVPSWWRFWEWR